MQLPEHILNQVYWYEHYRQITPSGYSYGDKFVLHYKQWWKWRETIWFEGTWSRSESGRHFYDSCSEAKELLEQLKRYFKDVTP